MNADTVNAAPPVKLANTFAYEALASAGLNLATATMYQAVDAIFNAVLAARPGIDEDLADWSAHILAARVMP